MPTPQSPSWKFSVLMVAVPLLTAALLLFSCAGCFVTAMLVGSQSTAVRNRPISKAQVRVKHRSLKTTHMGANARLWVDLLRDKDPTFHFEARTALVRIGWEAVPLLVDILLDDDNGFLREAAAQMLGDMSDRDALPALRKAARDDPDEQVRDTAEKAIRRLDP